ncbi:MAG: ATP-dependent Clp protease adapter ClpS [Mailhella sp.]|nr:ATP-dependent Clp protease adapter ClpS [Mailhella sp.]
MSQNHNADPSVEACVIVETELKEPDMYRVLLHNDDYTQMDFVVQVLVEIFRKSNEEAVAIMMSVHNSGSGVCGVYPREIAEFRVSQVERRAKDAGFPLLCTMEKD